MIWKASLAILPLICLGTPAAAVPLQGRYDAFVDAAAACVAATGTEDVDRSAIAAAGWPSVSSAETDDNVLSWAHSEHNPFVVRINSDSPAEPEHCWFTAEFEAQRDYDEVRRRLERRFGRAPDEADSDDMHGARWLNGGTMAELWMMPAHRLCEECPLMFFSVGARRPE